MSFEEYALEAQIEGLEEAIQDTIRKLIHISTFVTTEQDVYNQLVTLIIKLKGVIDV